MKKLITIALCALLAAVAAEAKTYYVNAKRPNNNGNGLKLKTAKKTIQAAINIAKNGDTIIVYPGTYAPIKTNNKKLTIKSKKGASQTTIVKPAKKKGVALAQLGKPWMNSYVDSHGKKHTSSSAPSTKGKNTTLAGFLLDGKIRDNGYNWLLGISGGTAKSCAIRQLGKDDRNWDGIMVALNATLSGCTMVDNHGALANQCVLNRCKLQNNVSDRDAYWYGDHYDVSGGFVYNSRLSNCLIAGNRFSGTSGTVSYFSSSTLLNCTVADNRIGHKRALFSAKSKYYNCILRNNARSWMDWTSIDVEMYMDEYGNWVEGKPATPGYVDEFGDYYEYQTDIWSEGQEVEQVQIHNVDSGKGNRYYRTFQDNKDPKFVNEAKGNYKLAKGSPCINKGKLTAAQKKQLGSLDLAGGKRIKNKVVDMGCYEY